jgi:flavin reductase (DIM6/NTAB) family NADH-FMN oxidoreductase RutF
MLFEAQDLINLDRKYRLNLINSLSGVKPVNLVGTRSTSGLDNLAIISSVVHLGSNPAQLGFILRPQHEAPKDTYLNISETGFYTINHVSESFLEKAHYTSAKLPREESEFDRMKIEREIIKNYPAPFVKESAIKFGMQLLDILTLPNKCLFVIGEVQLLQIPDESINNLGQIDLSLHQGIGLSGLNTYYTLEKKASYPYVRNNEIPDFHE